VDAEWRSRCIGSHRRSYVKKSDWPETKLHCVFGLSVITDEITQDFAHALEVASSELPSTTPSSR